MGEAIVTVLLTTALFFLCGYGLFRAVNKPRRVIFPDSEIGGTKVVTVRGTRRSRWRGYFTLGGAVAGYNAFAAPLLWDAAQTGKFNSMAHTEVTGAGLLFGLLVGLALGAVSSLALTNERPDDWSATDARAE